MKRPLLLSMISLAWLGGAGIAPSMATQQDAPIPVLARDMKELGAWVQWTRREGYCTVQIILEARSAPPDRKIVANTGNTILPTPQPKALAPQVWLLRADGTAMPVLRTSVELPKSVREFTATYTYAFPESAAKEATAIAVMINGRYYVEKLEPFPDGK